MRVPLMTSSRGTATSSITVRSREPEARDGTGRTARPSPMPPACQEGELPRRRGRVYRQTGVLGNDIALTLMDVACRFATPGDDSELLPVSSIWYGTGCLLGPGHAT